MTSELLHDRHGGRRLYLTAAERAALLAAAAGFPRPVRTFCGVLAHTGCRVSEALQLTPRRVDLGRAGADVREPQEAPQGRVPGGAGAAGLGLDQLDLGHGVAQARKRGEGRLDRPLWPWTRTHASRRVKAAMHAAGIGDGPHATAKGRRHGYGVYAIASGGTAEPAEGGRDRTPIAGRPP